MTGGEPVPQEPPRDDSNEDRGHAELKAWLRGLDAGRGALMQFAEPLCQEFGDLLQLRAAADPPTDGSGSVLECVDPHVFEILGVTNHAQKLMLAHGICALAKGR